MFIVTFFFCDNNTKIVSIQNFLVYNRTKYRQTKFVDFLLFLFSVFVDSIFPLKDLEQSQNCSLFIVLNKLRRSKGRVLSQPFVLGQLF
jgi:hypothetical protein